MKQRAQHIAVVLASAPIFYGLELLIRALNPEEPSEPFHRYLWKTMWEDLRGQ